MSEFEFIDIPKNFFPDPEKAAEAGRHQYKTLVKRHLWDRPGIPQLVKATRDKFFAAPASGREDFHGCFPGGLVAHSVNVTEYAVKLWQSLQPEGVSLESVLLVGLFHDLGKIGNLSADYYVEATEDWEHNKGIHYRVNKELVAMDGSIRTFLLMNQFGVQLTEAECQAIVYQDGQYAWIGDRVRNKEQPLTLICHYADYWSAHVDGL